MTSHSSFMLLEDCKSKVARNSLFSSEFTCDITIHITYMLIVSAIHFRATLR